MYSHEFRTAHGPVLVEWSMTPGYRGARDGAQQLEPDEPPGPSDERWSIWDGDRWCLLARPDAGLGSEYHRIRDLLAGIAQEYDDE